MKIAAWSGGGFSCKGFFDCASSFELAPLRMTDLIWKPKTRLEIDMIKSVRGTRDLLPPETALWNFVESAVRDVFRAYNFQEIRTPIFEETALFARSVGEETDIVAKEMYTWEDRGRAASEKGQSLTLRPEATAGIVRAYIEHKLGD